MCQDYAFLFDQTDEAAFVMARCLSKEKLTTLLSKRWEKLQLEDKIKLVRFGADPCQQDENGISCIDKAFDNQQGIYSLSQLYTNQQTIWKSF